MSPQIRNEPEPPDGAGELGDPQPDPTAPGSPDATPAGAPAPDAEDRDAGGYDTDDYGTDDYGTDVIGTAGEDQQAADAPVPALRFVALSNTGLVRANNQDSGYAGPNLLLVADGMGGHAGGDVASAVTVAELEHLDTGEYGLDAPEHLRLAILDANEKLSERVGEQPELAGMGTTVTALLKHGSRFALAHIGDSRAYVYSHGELAQVTHDHTFVQLLVDEGRITTEEAERHPQRSVVMRVLGDVGSSPELDLSVREARIGDRWLLCSDGLSGFVSDIVIEETLAGIEDHVACAERLVDLALQAGAPDNVTVILADVIPDDGAPAEHQLVGSVRINPTYSDRTHTGEQTPVDPRHPEPGSILDGVSRLPVELSAAAHGSPAPAAHARDDDADDWDLEPRRGRRWIGWLIAVVVILLLALAAFAGYRWTQGRYYVGDDAGDVAIFQGISQDLGPIGLSHVYEHQNLPVSGLTPFARQRVEATIPADSLAAARALVTSLESDTTPAQPGDQPTDATTDQPTSPGTEPATPPPTGTATP